MFEGFKKQYDLVLIAIVATYLVLFTCCGCGSISLEIRLIRAFGTAALLLLHVVLSIGPLARLDRRFLPLLYNRRHMGVLTFLLGLAHAILAVGFYHGFGVLNPLHSLLVSNTQYASVSAFPFEILGLLALLILFLMAATSHDLWLHTLTPAIWKTLHMLVYAAYVLLVGHVALGALQSEPSPLYPIALVVGIVWLSTLHILASRSERRAMPVHDWVDAGEPRAIPEGRAVVVTPPAGERIAIFRHAGRLSAVSNVCAHQAGPLGEGRIVDGCITCPWHGYQYRPADGCAPPPFAEKVPTYRLRLRDGRVEVDPTPLPAGHAVEPLSV